MKKSAVEQVLCPMCGALFDLEQAWNDADGRRFVQLLTSLPPAVIRPLYNYLKLFKPVKQSLRWQTILKLTQELAPMISRAVISRNGIEYAVPIPMWLEVLDGLARNRPESLVLPLKGHGYLLTILANQAEKAAHIDEREVDKRRQQRVGAGQPTGMQAFADYVPQTMAKASKPPAGWQGKADKERGNDD